MQTNGTTAANHRTPKRAYVWEAPGKKVSIALDFDVVDRLGEEVQRGFRAAPRRGLEVGGILLGKVDGNGHLAVRIEDFEPVPVCYSEGPSYRVGADDRAGFEEALERWAPEAGTQWRPVGYYRSHTREGLGLDQHDQALLDRYFPQSSAIVLLVRPDAHRSPQAGFFFREGGILQHEMSPREFPFRRQELGGGPATVQAKEAPVNLGTIFQPAPKAAGRDRRAFGPNTPAQTALDDTPPEGGGVVRTLVPSRSLRLRGGWVWIPVSCVFVLFGTIIGFLVAISVRSKVTDLPQRDPYALHLSATPTANSVHLRWDRNSPAIEKAESGVLMIYEEGRQKSVDLDTAHLRNGSVIYRRASNDIRFVLEVHMPPHISVSEMVEFSPVNASQPPGDGA